MQVLSKIQIRDLKDHIKTIERHLDSIKALVSDETTEDEEEAIRRVEDGCCVYCGEEVLKGETVFRGAHQRCYKRVRRVIASGEITEDQAISRGWLLVTGKAGRKLDENDPLIALQRGAAKKRDSR